MNIENKKLAELIITNLKNNNGVMSLSEFGMFFKNDHNSRLSIGRILIDDLNLLDRIGTTSVRLTNKGWEFESFEKIEKENTDKAKLELDLAKSNLESNKLNKEIAERNIKTEKRNIVFTWINIGIGVINLVLIAWQILQKK